ncbi:MAG: bifunctional 2-polyprenyl-6-hydroxyphenol methylase/3-demethylubiquinol 3-O-methyltransferase UbiG [Hyphomonadaceae bacterium]|nr:bifunctional 2-polyprenyl-6-hydroxyphenol methylase/3-demethylubiquinol 3-O-methyltransferase UbiG [Hyphomonadaceae bacterium]
MAETRDPAEIAKFSALATEWWDPNGPFAALHRVNPLRLSYLRDVALTRFGGVARSPLAGLNVADLGCGGGLASAPMARMGGAVTGIDASREAIGAARAHAASTGLDIRFEETTAEALRDRGESFDVVVAFEIVEHVSDVGVFLSAASDLVRPGGVFVLSTINRTPKARALAIVGAERILKWAPDGAHEYDKLVRPDEIRMHAPALSWDDPVGIAYEPLGRGWTLSHDTDVNYLMAGHKPR